MVDDEVGGQGGLVRSEAPDEEDVHLSDAFYPQEGGLDHVVADTGGSGLYQHLQSVPEGSMIVLWFQINNKSCCQYSWNSIKIMKTFVCFFHVNFNFT